MGGGYRKVGSSREPGRRPSLPLTLQMAQDVLGQSWVVVWTPAVPGGRREAVRGTWLGVWSLGPPLLDTPWKYPTGDRGDTGSRPGDSPTGWSQQDPSPRHLCFGRPWWDRSGEGRRVHSPFLACFPPPSSCLHKVAGPIVGLGGLPSQQSGVSFPSLPLHTLPSPRLPLCRPTLTISAFVSTLHLPLASSVRAPVGHHIPCSAALLWNSQDWI